MLERLKWPGLAVVLGVLGAILRRWQLNTAYEAGGFLTRGAPATAALVAFLILAAAVSFLLASTIRCRVPQEGRMSRWDLTFAAEGDTGYMTLMVLAALCVLAACPLLLKEAAELYAIRKATGEGDNGLLQAVLAVCALPGGAALILSARDSFRMKGRGRENTALLLPAVLGCVWVLAAYRANAADPVRWNYVPLVLAAVCGMLFYMACAGLSFESGHPREMLWTGAATVVTSAVALAGKPDLGATALLAGQMLAALAALWVAPHNLLHPPAADRFGLRARRRMGLPLNEEDENEAEEPSSDAQEIQEEDDHV